MQANTFSSCSLKEWAILLALKGCFTDESNSVHNLICFQSGLNRAEWVMEWQDFWGYQYKNHPVSLLSLLFPLLAAPVIACNVGYSQKTEGRNSWAKGQVKTAKVLLWQKKLKCMVLFLLETEPRTKKALNERLKLAGRADTFFNIVVNPCMYWKMLIGKEKSEKQAFSSSIISRKIRIMRGAALRVESKHEETRQSNANMCKALQKQRGR